MAVGWIRQHLSGRSIALTCAGGLLGALVAVMPMASASETGGSNCREATVPITVAGQTGPIAGTLCGPEGAKTIQVLVPGVSYARYYWDLPYQPERYSYRRVANQRGYATLTIDRLGTGRSWHPLSPLISYDSNTSVVHQVIQAVRKGDLGARFDKVVLVGHSLGSAISYTEAGTYQDVDAVVFTGAAHLVDPGYVAKIRASAIPAVLDPKFAGSGYDPGYQTTRPGTRDIFYHKQNADPEVIALDEKLKQTFTDVELGTVITLLASSATKNPAISASKRINVPTFTIVGDQDRLFCAGAVGADCSSSEALANFERPYFGPHAIVEAKVIEGAGHDLNLERTAPSSNAAILDFVDRHVGAGATGRG